MRPTPEELEQAFGKQYPDIDWSRVEIVEKSTKLEEDDIKGGMFEYLGDWKNRAWIFAKKNFFTVVVFVIVNYDGVKSSLREIGSDSSNAIQIVGKYSRTLSYDEAVSKSESKSDVGFPSTNFAIYQSKPDRPRIFTDTSVVVEFIPDSGRDYTTTTTTTTSTTTTPGPDDGISLVDSTHTLNPGSGLILIEPGFGYS